MSPEILDTAVVGAGPYGLSVAAHAKARGVRARVFGTPMQAWAGHMPVGMKLKSEPENSNLSDPSGRYTLQAYCKEHGLPYEHGLPVPVDTFVAYGRWFRDQTGPDLHDIEVAGIRRDSSVFALELADEHIVHARSVVLAAGFLPFPRIPEVFADLEWPQLLHSSDLHELSGFFGKRIAVIGAGQSAIETAVLLDDQGADVTLIVRAPALAWNGRPAPLDRPLPVRLRSPHTGLGPGLRNKAWADAPGLFRRLSDDRRAEIVRTTLGPAGSWWLRDRFDRGFTGEAVFCGTVVASAKFDTDRVVLELGAAAGADRVTGRLEVDHVVAATGYDVDVRRLTVLQEPLRSAVRGLRGRAGAPRLGPDFQTSVPGLHTVGLASAGMFGPAMRFVFGCGFTAKRVARSLAR
jgi:cation diffusion facilitator CzcD-associated flavoprotein CzcO